MDSVSPFSLGCEHSFGGSVHPLGLGRAAGQMRGRLPALGRIRGPLGSSPPALIHRHNRVHATQSINGAFNPLILCSLLEFSKTLVHAIASSSHETGGIWSLQPILQIRKWRFARWLAEPLLEPSPGMPSLRVAFYFPKLSSVPPCLPFLGKGGGAEG